MSPQLGARPPDLDANGVPAGASGGMNQLSAKPPDLDASGKQAASPPTGNDLFDAALRGTGNILIGAVKQPGRLVQMVPGIAAATDYVYGLPPGASKASMQPSNTAQRIGGYLADAAETVATLGADVPFVPDAAPGLKVIPKTIGTKIAEPLTAMGEGFVAAAKKSIFGGGPVTADKIGAAVEKLGEKAVKAALYGAGAGMLWEAWKKL